MEFEESELTSWVTPGYLVRLGFRGNPKWHWLDRSAIGSSEIKLATIGAVAIVLIDGLKTVQIYSSNYITLG